MRDTFDRFQPRERGRFGDNESDDRVERVELVRRNLVWRMDKGGATAFSREAGSGQQWIWLPRSQIRINEVSRGPVPWCEVFLPRWLAEKKGLADA